LIQFTFRLLGYETLDEMVSIPKVDAEAKIKPEKGKMSNPDQSELKPSAKEESSDSEEEEEGEEEKEKKKPKDKVGFRDRKVNVDSVSR
jgi:hypothetical protein